jgi:hypothetical protein
MISCAAEKEKMPAAIIAFIFNPKFDLGKAKAALG